MFYGLMISQCNFVIVSYDYFHFLFGVLYFMVKYRGGGISVNRYLASLGIY